MASLVPQILVVFLIVFGATSPSPALASAAPPHYEGNVTLGPARDAISATMTIRGTVPTSGEYRFLLGRTFKLTQVDSEGAEASVVETEKPFPGILQAIVLKAPVGGPFTLRVSYAGTLVQMQQPPINSVSPELVELSVDSWWLPYPSDLNSGLTADMQFTGLAAGVTTVSTGIVSPIPGGVKIHLERPNDLALISAPNLRERREGKFVFYSEDPDGELASTYRKHGTQALSELEALYGPIPGGSARVVVVPRAAPNGYNRRGYFVVSARATKQQESTLAISLVHEIAHSWWSKADFLGSDYWLVEGPAEYTGVRYGRKHFGTAVMAPRLERARTLAASAGPVVREGRSPDAAIYSKAMLLLTDLEERLGEQKMDRLLRRVAAADQHTTAVFLAILADEAGPNMANEFEQRLEARE